METFFSLKIVAFLTCVLNFLPSLILKFRRRHFLKAYSFPPVFGSPSLLAERGLGGEVLAQTPKLSFYEDTSGRGWGWGAYGKTHTPPLNAVLPYDDGVGVASAIPIIIPS